MSVRETSMVKDLTDEELLLVLKDRKEERRRRAIEERRDINTRLLTNVFYDIEAINALVPRHSLRNCSDKDLEGAYMDNGEARCVRCFLLDARGTGTLDPSVVVSLTVREDSDLR